MKSLVAAQPVTVSHHASRSANDSRRRARKEPGRLLRLRDDSGQIDLITAQTRLCSINEPVEATGYPSINGMEWKLREAFYRPFVSSIEQPVSAGAGMRPIRVAAQVLELPPEEATRGHPVLLSGIVTWSHPDAPFFFVHDGSGGICVQRGSDTSKVRPPGRNVEVVGITAMGDFAPVAVSIVASGYSHDPVMADFRAHGFRAVVAKPFEPGQLRQAILDVLQRAPA